MKQHTKKLDTEGLSLSRKRFLGLSASALVGAPFFLASCANEKPAQKESHPVDPDSWWKEGRYIVHDSVDASLCDEGVIKAKVNGSWRKFDIKNLPREFVEWSLTERAYRLERLARYGFSERDLAGPHNACVATFGGPKRDSSVSINTAYKGMGFVPRKEKLSTIIDQLVQLKKKIEADLGNDFREMLVKKTEVLGKIYSERGLFDTTKQVSLELFTHRNHPTHTFLNMMANPIASASFLAYPTFELRAIPQLLHFADPGLSDYERKIVDYTNMIHNFIHGGTTENITCVYHVIEVFDDTPNTNAMGKRLV
jgi:hypothetical protein